MVDMQKVFDIHQAHTGVLETRGLFPIKTPADLSEAYTPGVAGLATYIAEHPAEKGEYTLSGKLVAVISDGTAVLGLGDIGPGASLPIIEGKSLIYKDFAGVNAIPLAIEQVETEEVVNTIANIAPSFAGIHLEDIKAPRCFEIETSLQDRLNIPVYHDDQEGTAIVVLAGLINAAKVVNKPVKDLKVVINGVGASGYATAKLLAAYGMTNLTLVDIHGKITPNDTRYNHYQRDLAASVTSAAGDQISEVIKKQDAFVGLSDANVLSADDVEHMADKPIVFGLANPVPEIDPKVAADAGAAVIATGSSQWPNQVNNILVFPGLFKGLLQTNLTAITMELQGKVAEALANLVAEPTAQEIVPGVFNEQVVATVEQAVIAFDKQGNQ